MGTSTIKSSGGDYTSLSAWEADKQADLTGLGPEIAECYDLDDVTDVAVAGWTTTATDYIEIRAATAARCNGSTRAQTGNTYRLSGSNSSGQLRISQNHVRVIGIEIKATGGQVGASISFISGSSDIRIEDCVISSNDASANTGYTCLFNGANITVTLRNCLVTGRRRAIDTRNATSSTIDHCTFYTDAADLGVVSNSELTCTNTYVGGFTSECFWTAGTAPSGSHNASSDTSASTDYTSSLTSKAASDQFTNPSISDSTMDFSLKATSDLIDVGTGSEANDISDTARIGTVDIGAFEYLGGASGTTVNATVGTAAVTANSATVNNALNISATIASITVTANSASIAEGGDPSITTEPLKNNTGTVLSGQTVTASVYSISTGALVVRKTGLTSDGSGIVTFTDAALSAAMTYQVVLTIGSADGVARITTG